MPHFMMPSPIQVRMARMLLGIKRSELAKLSGVSERAIGNYEAGATKLIRLNHEAVRKTLEKLGVEFLDDDGVKRNQD
jgi:transcriptional regulator with XRE-family HTH domain